MFTGIHVDHTALNRASTDLAASASAIESRLTRLETDLGPLRSRWGGSAQESYVEAQKRWDQAMGELVTLLKDFSVTLDEANSEYRAADLRGSRRFS